MWPYHVGMVNPVLIEFWRGDAVEAFHRGRYAVWRDGDVVDEAGEAQAPVFVRSGAKYFQALTCLMAGAGDRFSGPAVIEEFGSTTPILPGFDVVVDELGNLVVRKVVAE